MRATTKGMDTNEIGTSARQGASTKARKHKDMRAQQRATTRARKHEGTQVLGRATTKEQAS